MLKLDAIQTLGFAALVLAAGYLLRARIRPLARLNIPAPVIGGLLVSIAISICHVWDVTPLELDTAWQSPLMIAFFTSVGFGASFGLLKRGGPQVGALLAIARSSSCCRTWWARGSRCCSASIRSSACSRAPSRSQVDLRRARPSLRSSKRREFKRRARWRSPRRWRASCSVVCSVVRSAPGLIERQQPRASSPAAAATPETAEKVVEDALENPTSPAPKGEDSEAYALMKTVGVILVAMWLGSVLSAWLKATGVTLPAYIGAMVVAVMLRNVDEKTKWFKLSQRLIDDVGTVALAFFLVQALMTLKLWELRHLAVPLVVLLVVQTIVIVAARRRCWSSS